MGMNRPETGRRPKPPPAPPMRTGFQSTREFNESERIEAREECDCAGAVIVGIILAAGLGLF